jgi:hypothetical protein
LSAQTWTASQLTELTDGEELVLVLTREDKPTLRVPVWPVTVAGVAYVRSYLGVTSGWYVRVIAEPRQSIALGGVDVPVEFELVSAEAAVNVDIDAAFVRKYATDDYRDAMITPLALDATLRILPV